MSKDRKLSSMDVNVKICLQDIVKYDLLVKASIQGGSLSEIKSILKSQCTVKETQPSHMNLNASLAFKVCNKNWAEKDIRECSGPIEILNTLNMRVGKNMHILKNSIDEMERLANEQNKDDDKGRILEEVENHRKQLASNQIALRKANLACQMRIHKCNKDELYEGASSNIRQRMRADKESLTKTSSSITDSLVGISKMMASRVKQSEETLQSLVSSSNTVTDTNEELKSMGNVIHQSRKLLTKYNRRELTDKVLIFLALAFFFACVLYVLKKRLL